MEKIYRRVSICRYFCDCLTLAFVVTNI